MSNCKDLIPFKNVSYNYSFIGKNNLKEIYNQWDLYINWSINQGNSHYSFTINFPNSTDYHKLSNFETYKNILNLKPLSKEEPFNYGSDFNCTYSNFKELENSFFSSNTWWEDVHSLLAYQNLTTWIFTVTEENQNGYIHLHGIIAIRNIIDYNKNIRGNILNEFKDKYNFCDVVMKNLNSFNDIKGWIRYLHYNNIWVFRGNLYILPIFKEYSQKCFSIVYLKNYLIKNSIEYDLDGNEEYCNSLHFEVKGLLWEWDHHKFLNFKGIKLNKNDISEDIIIDLILNYIYLNDLYISGNNVYKRIRYSLISFNKLGSIKEIFFDKFQLIIINFYVSNFPRHFNNFDFYSLIKTYKNKMESNILKIISLTTNIVTFNFNIMEFTDGIYDIQNNVFLERDKWNNNFNYFTLKYYNKTYRRTSRNKPLNWIEGIKNALGKNNKEGFITLCLFIANLFQPTNENIKKNFLYIHGPSNTGKTTYLSKMLTRYYNYEYIGTIINDSNFKFQDIENKLLVILEEFNYKKGSASDFLKLLGGEKLLTTKKYSKEHITIENLKGIVISNNEINEKNKETKNALYNRLYVINFLNKIINNDININNSLSNEEANIIIFCNKLYFSYFNKKQKRTKTIIKNQSKSSYSLTNKSLYNFSFHLFIYEKTIGKLIKPSIKGDFKDKFEVHCNSKFSISKVSKKIKVQLDESLYLTFTKNPKSEKNAWKIGDLPNGKSQYLNKDNMYIVNNKLSEDKFIESKLPRDIVIRDNISKLVKENTDNIEEIEMDLSKFFTNNMNLDLNKNFERCLKYTNNVMDCIHVYNLNYSHKTIYAIDEFIKIYNQ